MSAVYICFCRHPKSQHKRERDGCRALDCGCAKFEADMAASAEVQGVEIADCPCGPYKPGDPSDAHSAQHTAWLQRSEPGTSVLGESLAARLCRVEQERDSLLAHNEELVNVSRERDDARGERDVKQRQLKDALAALDLARAELAEAYGLVEKIPGRKPVDVLREVIAAGQGASTELAHLREVVEMRCGHCWGLGLIPAENFGRDADGAPWTDEEQPCPDGCEIPSWLAGERNDAADDRRLLAEAQHELERLRGQLTDVRAATAEKVRAVLDASARPDRQVIAEHVRYLCETCGSRYGLNYDDHEHGPLTPVTVTIARQGAPTA